MTQKAIFATAVNEPKPSKPTTVTTRKKEQNGHTSSFTQTLLDQKIQSDLGGNDTSSLLPMTSLDTPKLSSSQKTAIGSRA